MSGLVGVGNSSSLPRIKVGEIVARGPSRRHRDGMPAMRSRGTALISQTKIKALRIAGSRARRLCRDLTRDRSSEVFARPVGVVPAPWTWAVPERRLRIARGKRLVSAGRPTVAPPLNSTRGFDTRRLTGAGRPIISNPQCSRLRGARRAALGKRRSPTTRETQPTATQLSDCVHPWLATSDDCSDVSRMARPRLGRHHDEEAEQGRRPLNAQNRPGPAHPDRNRDCLRRFCALA